MSEIDVQVVFRADASLEIGIGHVMRCLTLADALRQAGVSCCFVCREHPGNLIDQIRQRGYLVHALPLENSALESLSIACDTQSYYQSWLGGDWVADAHQTQAVLAAMHCDWMIVDHYAIDARWETALAAHYRRLMVIDDLANRSHACDILLDQTYARSPTDYQTRVPERCKILCGAQYALLRPEFELLRSYSLERRVPPRLKQLLISLGGVDIANVTGMVLQAIESSQVPLDCGIVVVMGATAPWRDEVQEQAARLVWNTSVLFDIKNMADVMADSDLAIGAAGASSWERCCLGLPAIMVVLAENQRKVAASLSEAGAAQVLQGANAVHAQLPVLLNSFVFSPSLMLQMGRSASKVTDGSGLKLVLQQLIH